MKKIIILGVVLFIGCYFNKNENYYIAKKSFESFDNLLSPQEYSNTIHFYMDNKGFWRSKNDSLVNIKIPYRGDFFSFSNSFKNQNPGNETGTLSRYISVYENGVQTEIYYELDKVVINSTLYLNPIYIIFLNYDRLVIKSELYSSKGSLIKESDKNFLQQIRRVLE